MNCQLLVAVSPPQISGHRQFANDRTPNLRHRDLIANILKKTEDPTKKILLNLISKTPFNLRWLPCSCAQDRTMNHQRRYNVERSCLRCHEHKIKCDKGTPCSKCMRQKVACQYPGPSRVKRQPSKKSTTEVAARLEQLEQFIMTMVNEGPTSLNSQNQGSSTISPMQNGRSNYKPPSKHPATADRHAYLGFLDKDGRYINEPFLSRVLEKEQELKSAIGSPIDATSPRRPPTLRADGLFKNPLSAQLDPNELFPSRWEGVFLWQTFLSRVETFVKVIHVPTAQSHIFAAINRPESARADLRALVFAICFAATTALLSDDTHNEVLHANLRRYQQGMELSLYHSEFLEAPTLISLQAMVIYQVRECFVNCP